jgi:hypothetical protein
MSKLCQEGAGYFRQNREPHRKSYQLTYNDFTRGLKGIRLSLEDSRAAYTCRTCKTWQGCGGCLEDIASIVCKTCRDWANDISEQVHGPMVQGAEFKSEGVKMVIMLDRGQYVTFDDYMKSWNEARAVLRPENFSISKLFGGAK